LCYVTGLENPILPGPQKDFYSLSPWEEKTFHLTLFGEYNPYILSDTMTIRKLLLDLKDLMMPVKMYYGAVYHHFRRWGYGINIEYERLDYTEIKDETKLINIRKSNTFKGIRNR
jgi:hypothetical protein